jgi:hypothetical protein
MSNTNSRLAHFLRWLSGAPADTDDTPPAENDQPLPPDAVTPSEATGYDEPVAETSPSPEVAVVVPSAAPASDFDPMAVVPKEGIVPEVPVDDATAYGVQIVPADIPTNTEYWQAIRVHHLTPEENHGNHHIFLDALGEGGDRIFNAQAQVFWDGGEQTVAIDRPLSEPGANFPMWKWQVCSVVMLGLPSDRVVNLHTAHPDEPPGDGNTLFHHSFQVDFQRSLKAVQRDSTLPAGKLLDYYVLFGPPASSRTAVYLAAARDFLVLRQPTFGFRSQDASHASQVIIIGELQDVDQTTEDALVAANCLVTRLQGSPAEVRAALDDLESIQF